jgi:hypothetical protein
MIPYDGQGYGRSIYWQNQAIDIAKNNSEKCDCWSETPPFIEFRDGGEFCLKVNCWDKTDACKVSFPKTEAELTNKFLRFYKV